MRFFPAPPSPFNPNGIRVRLEKHPVTLSPVEGLGWGMGLPVDGALSHLPLSLWLFSRPGACLFSSLSLGPLPLSFGVPSSRKLPLTAGSPLPQGTLSFSQFVSLGVGLCFLGTGTMSRCIHP